MPKYRYKAIDKKGSSVNGSGMDVNVAALEKNLSRKGLTLVTAKAVKENLFSGLTIARSVNTRTIIEIYYRISQTLELGLPIIDALRENARIVTSRYLKTVFEEIQISINNGTTLSEAMGSFPMLFGSLELALIRLGEQTGTLPKCLQDLARFLEWKEDIRSTIKRAAIYPVFIFAAIIAVLGVWVWYVLPQMESLLKSMGVLLPAVTVFVLDASRFLQEWWSALLAGCVLLMVCLALFRKTPNGNLICHKYILKMPLIGKVSHNIAIARLSHNFAAMYRAGMSVNHIFEVLSENVLGNRYLEQKLKNAYAEIQSGGSIADAFENSGGFSELLIGAIRNGETTGTLDESFIRLGNYYDAEVKRSVQTMINAMEPLSIVLLGGVFGVIALSILLPLYDVVGKIS